MFFWKKSEGIVTMKTKNSSLNNDHNTLEMSNTIKNTVPEEVIAITTEPMTHHSVPLPICCKNSYDVKIIQRTMYTVT